MTLAFIRGEGDIKGDPRWPDLWKGGERNLLSITAFLNGEKLMEQALRAVCGRGKERREDRKGQSDVLLCLCHTGMKVTVVCTGELGGWVLGPGEGESMTVSAQGGCHCVAASWVVLEESGQFKVLGDLC